MAYQNLDLTVIEVTDQEYQIIHSALTAALAYKNANLASEPEDVRNVLDLVEEAFAITNEWREAATDNQAAA